MHTEITEQAKIYGDHDRRNSVISYILENVLNFIQCSGVLDEELPRIFERFYQVEKSRRDHIVNGLGLGISISKEILKALGWTIPVYNDPQDGMTFVIKYRDKRLRMQFPVLHPKIISCDINYLYCIYQ